MDCTPVVNQSGVRTHTERDAVFNVSAGWVTAHFALDITQAGSAGNAITVTCVDMPPPVSAYAGQACGEFHYVDVGTAFYDGSVSWDGVSFTFYAHGESGQLGVDPSFATANGDFLRFSVEFRHA